MNSQTEDEQVNCFSGCSYFSQSSIHVLWRIANSASRRAAFLLVAHSPPSLALSRLIPRSKLKPEGHTNLKSIAVNIQHEATLDNNSPSLSA